MFGARLFRLRQGSNRVLSHEATHYVQLQEGFHRGGSTAALFTEADILSGVEETDSDAVRFDKYTKLIERKEDYTGSNRKIIDALERFYKGDGSVPTEVYKRLAGEVEARNVEYRLNMTPEQRRQKLLEETEEVAREDQIFLRDGMGEAMYTPPAKEIEEQLINTLKKNGLSTNVVLLNTNEINKKLQELGVDAETRKQVLAWHGSPYSFDRFEFSDRTFLSAEGNAAFGAGLYFTDLESIARNYAAVLSKKDDILIKNVDKSNLSDEAKILVKGHYINSVNKKEAIDLLNLNSDGSASFNEAIAFLQSYKGTKNLYKVSLHQGKTPDQYTWLEWDNPVSDKIWESIDKQVESEFGERPFYEFVKNNRGAFNGERLYNELSKFIGGEKEASLFLLEAGIDGIKYPAESISRGATSDTARGFNYVVFDENAITIEERIQFQKQLAENGIALTTKGFVDLKTKEIYLNKDLATNETLLHEYSHLFNAYTKQNHPELYKRGIALVKEQTEKENSEIKEIIEYVKQTQPSLEGEALYEEILTEFTARTTDEMLEKSGGIFEWLRSFWENLKGLLGLTQMSVEEVYKLDLKSYAEAVGRDLLRGEDLTQEDVTAPVVAFQQAKLEFKTNDGQTFLTYKEALQNSKDNEFIDVILNNEKVASLTATTANNSFEGVVNDLIKSNILSGERTLDTDGNIYYKPQGNSEVLKTINASIADTHLRTFIGHSNYKWMSDNTLRIEKPQEGQKAPKIMEMAAQLYNDLTAPFGDKRVLMEAVEITPQNELEKALLSLLEAMGVSTSVVEKFNDLSVNALADIANRIVAFKNGEISTELLSEETAHFIVEALPQAEIENLLRNVDKTPQWEQYSEQYMEKYGDENLVRREVLGKILKDAFVNKFNAENKPEIEQRFYNKLLQLFTDFINRVRAYFTPQNEQQLADFTEKVYRNLLAGDLINQMDLNQLEGNKIALFNAGNDLSTKEGLLYANARKTVELLTAQDRKLSTSSSATRKQLGDIEVEIDKAVEKQLEQIGAELENASKVTAIAGIAQIARKQVKHLNQAIEKNRPFSSEENVVYLNVIGKLNRYIATLSELLNPTVKAEKTLIDSLNEITLDIQKMASRKETAQNDLWEQEIQRLRVKNDMTDEEVAELRGALKAIQQDTTWLFSYLGSMTHAQNPLLNMAANRISRMTTETNSNFVRRSKAFYNTLEAIGFDVRKSKMFKDEGGYLLDIIDHNKYETDLYTYKTSLYNKMTNSDLSIPEFKKLEYNNGLKFENNEQKREYDEDWAAWQKENQYIDVLTEEARQEKENRLKNLSEKTRRFITRLSKESGAITRKARENDNEFTQYMYEELQELARQRKVAKSPFSVNGKLKQGLKFDENGELALDGNPLSEEATLSWELTQYDKQTEFKEKGIPQAFKDKLASFSNPMDAYEFLKYNATISFNNSFWETMKQGDNFVSKLRKAGLDSDADAIEKAQKFRTQILRKYANKNNPSEIDYSEMSATDIEDVKVKTEWLETEYARLKGKIKEENTDVDVAFSAVPNNAFFSELIDRLGSVRETPEHFNFILEHVSSKSRLNLEKARIMLEEVLAEEKEEIPEKWRELFTTPTDKEDAYSQLIAYGQTKLLPYFKRIEPKGGMYSETMRQLETNTITPMDFVNKIERGELPFISLSPSFIFETVEDDKNINPEWLENERLGRPQIDLKKYRNARYDKMFNPDANGNPTTNVVEWRALQEFVKFHEETLKSAGKSGSHNKFLLPQKGMRGWRQVENLVRNTNKESIQEMFRDFAMFREDTTELGQNADGTFNHAMKDTELIIPRYGFRRLENQDDLTDELFASYNWMAYNAEAYKARVNAFADMEAIKEQILNADLGGKDVLSSNMYKMFDSFIRHAIYGQQESFSYETDLFGILPRKYNLAPLAKKLQEWVRLVNLGFSFLVPVTSILQGSVNYQIEKSVGERIDKDASRLARRQLGRMLGRSVADSLKISAKSELNSMLEFFGVYNVATRYENSNYNRTVRGLSKASFLTHTLADAPIKGQVGLTVLHDFRVVNGSIINFNTFKRQGNYSSEKDARHEWAKYEDKALFNYLIVENGITSYNKEKLAEELPNVENLDEFLLDKTQRVKDAMEIANSDIDSIIPEDQKSVVQRHAIFSFFMMHRGWLVTAYNKRFKNRHYNFQTGEVEEGSWYGTLNYIRQMVKEARNPANNKQFIKSFKESWQKADETTRRSLQRVALDLAVTNAMGLVALMLMNYADDDEDKDFVTQFGAYMAYRVTNEVATSSVAYPRQIFEFLESPIVGLDKIRQIGSVADVFSDSQVKAGDYRQFSESRAWMFKSLPIFKEYYRLSNMDRERTTYEFHNKDNYNWIVPTTMMIEEEKE